MPDCPACTTAMTAPRSAAYVELIDGRVVMRDAEEWRAECEARYVLSLQPLEKRRAWIADIERKRGKAAADALRAGMTMVFEAGRIGAVDKQQEVRG